jgi:rhodanese-related sulfurtransferase
MTGGPNPVSSTELVERALAEVEAVSPELAAQWLADPRYVFVDVRNGGDWSRARIPEAVNAPRGMLEFYIDPASSFHLPVFGQPAGRTFVFYCGSGARAALSARVAREMGLGACCIAGGFRSWQEAGLPVTRAPDPERSN